MCWGIPPSLLDTPKLAIWEFESATEVAASLYRFCGIVIYFTATCWVWLTVWYTNALTIFELYTCRVWQSMRKIHPRVRTNHLGGSLQKWHEISLGFQLISALLNFKVGKSSHNMCHQWIMWDWPKTSQDYSPKQVHSWPPEWSPQKPFLWVPYVYLPICISI